MFISLHLSHVMCNVSCVKCHVPHVIHDIWNMTHDIHMWHVKRGTQGVVNIVSTFQVPSSYGLAVRVFCGYFRKDDWVTHRSPSNKQTTVLLWTQLEPRWRECETTKSVRVFQSDTTPRQEDIETPGFMEIKVNTQDLLPEKFWSCRRFRSLRKYRLKVLNAIMY